jgi:hypothetical protein
MSMKDAMDQRDRPRIHDGRGGIVGTRPGFVVSDVNRDARRQAYLDYERDLANAYKDQGRPPAGAYPFAEHLVGTACSQNGFPGRLQRQGDWLVCVPDRKGFNGSNGDEDEPDLEMAQSDRRTVADIQKSHAQKMSQLYAERDAELSQQWRSK